MDPKSINNCKKRLFDSQYLLDSGELVGLEEYRAAPGRKEGPHLLPFNFFFCWYFLAAKSVLAIPLHIVDHLWFLRFVVWVPVLYLTHRYILIDRRPSTTVCPTCKYCTVRKNIFCTGPTQASKISCTGKTSPMNQLRKDPFHFTLWVPIHLNFNSHQGPTLSSLSDLNLKL